MQRHRGIRREPGTTCNKRDSQGKKQKKNSQIAHSTPEARPAIAEIKAARLMAKSKNIKMQSPTLW
jgi:hypothetical protein